MLNITHAFHQTHVNASLHRRRLIGHSQPIVPLDTLSERGCRQSTRQLGRRARQGNYNITRQVFFQSLPNHNSQIRFPATNIVFYNEICTESLSVQANTLNHRMHNISTAIHWYIGPHPAHFLYIANIWASERVHSIRIAWEGSGLRLQ